MAADKKPELLRHREGQHEMMTWPLSIELALEPLPGFVVLAQGTVAIAAGAINHMGAVTLIALIKSHT